MGVKALMSHSKGTKHVKKAGAVQRIKTETRPLVSMWQSKTSCNTNSNLESKKQCEASSSITPNIDTDASDDMMPLTLPPPPTDTASTKPQTYQSSISKFVLADDQWTAEILWAMKTIMSHYSSNSSKGTDKLFRRMFPDSQIASKFTCGPTKCSYVICHGLAQYYSTELEDKLKDVPFYAICFDESFNSDLHASQIYFIYMAFMTYVVTYVSIFQYLMYNNVKYLAVAHVCAS